MMMRHGLAMAAIAALMATTAAAETTLRRSGDLGFGGAENLDPISPTRFYEANDLIYNRLVSWGPDGLPAPELAKSWSASPDAMEWTLVLQDGVKFHDGSDFDATDVKYSLERIKDPALESPVTSVLNMIDRVEVVDPLTAKIVLSSAHADLPLLFLDYRVRMIPDGSGATIATTGIGTGPFKLETLDPEGTTVLLANDDYWQGRPKVDRVEIISIPDQEARIQALLGGQLDYSDLNGDQVATFEGNEDFVIQHYPSGDWQGLVMRTDTAPFTDARVRKALRMVVNRQEMADLVVGPGGGTPSCDHPVWAGDSYRSAIECGADIEGAKALLAEAGYADGIDIDVHTSDLEAGMVRMVEVYQQQAAPAGIRVNIVMAAPDGFWSDVWMVEPFVSTSWGQRPADQILNEAYRSGSSWNESYFADAEFDSLLDQARAELDLTKRTALYHAAQAALWERGGSLIPYHINGVRAVRAVVKGMPEAGEDYIAWHLVEKTGD